MQATVYKSTGSWYIVKDDTGKFWNARMKGVMKLDNITSTNPVAVGDIVEIESQADTDNSAMIEKIKSVCASGRKKSFCLPSPNPSPKKPPEPIDISDSATW